MGKLNNETVFIEREGLKSVFFVFYNKSWFSNPHCINRIFQVLLVRMEILLNISLPRHFEPWMTRTALILTYSVTKTNKHFQKQPTLSNSFATDFSHSLEEKTSYYLSPVYQLFTFQPVRTEGTNVLLSVLSERDG